MTKYIDNYNLLQFRVFGLKLISTLVPGYFAGYAQKEFISVHTLASRASNESENFAVIPSPLTILSAKKYFFFEGKDGFQSITSEIEYEFINKNIMIF